MQPTRRSKPRRAMRQIAFGELRKDGKRRQKPGPKAAARANVRHRVRPTQNARIPLHITMRAVAGLPSFREQLLFRAFEKAVRTTRREGFHIIEYSVQSNHLHLIVEAADKTALARGMASFAVRANRLFNVASGRGRGRVWGDRYHRRDLATPRQVPNALVYCLNNFRKHATGAIDKTRIDGASSGPSVEGWNRARSSLPDRPCPTEVPKQYLLTTLWWKKHGRIDPAETPKQPG